ncbi:MAG: DegT/DnrJ/EryC1/StrS family aminotransferase [Candidatus Ratteibacteria bacterium]|nr:DegT/DnrJ/EryC1/StrS family aminotransferase [Candidatus Ratteibacteria bacterium]
MGSKSKLSIFGGEMVIPKGTIKEWPPIDDIDKRYVLASLEGTNHAFGPNCVSFEREFAEWNGNRYAITTNSGTAALHMCIAGCGLGVGDEIIVPAYSWSSSATCVLHHNCIPVFVDIDYDTMNIDVEKIEEKITEKTRAIIVVHLHGLSADMDRVLSIARKYNLKVIEDACQSHGAKYKGKKVGTIGDCAAFSFNQNKCLCSGEGGMFVTDNEQIYEEARKLWSFGEIRTPVEKRDYHAYALGWMYRNNDLTASFGRAQLTKLDDYLKVQRENAEILKEEIRDVNGLISPFEPEGYTHTWYNFTSRISPDDLGYRWDVPKLRDGIMKALQSEGVPVGIWQSFILPAMTVFQAKNAYGRGCPWKCQFARDLVYSPDDYPCAQKHCDTHFGMTTPLRAPNDKKVAKLVGIAFHKVFDNIDQIKENL